MARFDFRTDELALLLAGREGSVDAVSERLRWFLHFAQYRSVSATCRQFGIPRTTFYRWAQRFDPRDLTTLENRPTAPEERNGLPSSDSPETALSGRGAALVLREPFARSLPMAGGESVSPDASACNACHSESGPMRHRCLLCRLQRYDWSAVKRTLLIASILANLALFGFFASTVFLEAQQPVKHATPAHLSASLPQP